MKKLILAAVATTLAASPALAAAPMQHHDTKVVVKKVVVKPGPRAWHKGERFDRRYASNYQVVDYRRYRGLKAPPRGYRYVRSGNDAVLVAITTGVVAAVVANAIH